MTSYDVIFNPFLEKIEKDIDFFIYDGLDEIQTKEIINRRCNGFLNKATMEFKGKSKSEVDFNNKDDTLQTFNFDLIPEEIDIFIDLIYVEYMNQDISRLKTISPYFTEGEISKLFSPANERKTYLEMIKQLKEDVDFKIKKYNGKDRKTGKIKLPNYDLVKIGENYVN